MNESITLANRVSAAARCLRWLLLCLGVAALITAVLLPSHVLAWLRSDYYAWLGRPLNWLDTASTDWLDLTHVVLFSGIALLVASLWPRQGLWRIAVLLMGLAVITELAQFWVPGREPRLGDVFDNLLGIALGLAMAMPVRWLLSVGRRN